MTRPRRCIPSLYKARAHRPYHPETFFNVRSIFADSEAAPTDTRKATTTRCSRTHTNPFFVCSTLGGSHAQRKVEGLAGVAPALLARARVRVCAWMLVRTGAASQKLERAPVSLAARQACRFPAPHLAGRADARKNTRVLWDHRHGRRGVDHAARPSARSRGCRAFACRLLQ